MASSRRFICTNCGVPVNELYKEYSPSVLKLTNCLVELRNTSLKFQPNCQQVADKYIEYDLVIIIIDLILLGKQAYRHILCNTDFKFHWKLALILHIIEAYYHWSQTPDYNRNETTSSLKDFNTDDLKFYTIILLLYIRTICFISTALLLTFVYNRRCNISKTWQELLLEIWKCMTLSSFGIFLFLPSLIWGSGIFEDYSLSFIVFYTTLSQLCAYKFANNCSKGWAIFVILMSHISCRIPNIIYRVNNYM